jgi:hypothetical protein
VNVAKEVPMSRLFHHGLGGLFALLGGALGCELPLSPGQHEMNALRPEQTQASLTAETNAVHMLGVDRDGRLRHTIRFPNGGWSGLGDVATQAGEIGRITDVGSAYSDSVLFVAARTGNDAGAFQWFLTQRFDHGPWSQFAPLANSSQIADVGMDRTIDGNVHFCGQGGRLFHGIWRNSTGFGGFNELPVQRPAGVVEAVDCAAVGGELHYLVAYKPNIPGGPTIELAIAVRRANGTWSGFERTHALPSSEGTIGSVGLEASGDTLHLQVSTMFRQFHAMKLAGGAWSGVGNVESVAGDPQNQFESRVDSGAIAAVLGELHLIQATRGDTSGRVWHTIRSPSGGWAAFADIGAAMPLPGGLPFGGLFNVTLSRSRNN